VKHRLLLTILFSIITFMAVACSSDEPTPTPWPAPAFVEGQCDLALPASVDVTCGTVAVPQDRNSDGRATFALAVAALASESEAPAADPVVYLAGGPGENALDTLEFTFEDIFRPFLASRDVVVFDQRGAGRSEPRAECDELAQLEIDLLDQNLSIDEEGTRFQLVANACQNRLVGEGVALNALSTAESAADVHAIMSALGYTEWNLLGISYGTRLAQTVMRDRPEGVRSVILDSVVPLEADMVAQTPASFDRALQALFDSCAADETCAKDYPNLEATLANAVILLNEQPLPGTVTNQLTLETYDSIANGSDLAAQLFQGLYSSQVIPLLPEMISLASQGESGLLDLLRGVSLTNSPFLSTGMQIALQCTEEAAFTSEEQVREAGTPHSRVRDMLEGSRPMGSDIFPICDHWDLPDASPLENEGVESEIPTLVLAGGFDPVTPPQGGRTVSDRLINSTFVEFPGAGHASLTSGECAIDIAIAFLTAPSSAVDSSCATDQPPPDWVRPVEATTFEPYDAPVFGFTSLRPVGWVEFAPGAFGRSDLGVVTLLEQIIPGATSDQLIGLLRSSVPGNPEFLSFGAFVSDHFTWDLVMADAGGQLLLLAFAEGGSALPMVMVTGLRSQEEALLTHVLGPILEAFAPSP
jgi:pimeloyl-ACP methyl ester carboxylesterase